MRQPELAAVLGHIGDAEVHASRGVRTVTALPLERDRAGGRRLDAEQRETDIGASGADQPGEAQHLAAAEVEADVLEHALAAEPRDRQQQLARARRRARLKQAHLAPDHVGDGAAAASPRRAARVEISRPSRNTVTRSAISKTSSMRWLTKRIATPWPRRSRDQLNSCATSWADSDAVGSSMIRTRTLSEIALAISTDCCAASVRPRAGLRTSMATPSVGEDRLGLARTSRASRSTCAAVLVADEDVLGDVQVGEEQRLLVDRRDAEALRLGGAADGHRLAVEQDLAAVGLVDAGDDLDQRRLAGAVLAEQRMDLARIERRARRRRAPGSRRSAWRCGASRARPCLRGSPPARRMQGRRRPHERRTAAARAASSPRNSSPRRRLFPDAVGESYRSAEAAFN